MAARKTEGKTDAKLPEGALPTLVNDPAYRGAAAREEAAGRELREAEEAARSAQREYARLEARMNRDDGAPPVVEEFDKADEARREARRRAGEARAAHGRAREALEETGPRKREEVKAAFREEHGRILARAFRAAEELHELGREHGDLRKLYGQSVGEPYPPGCYTGDLPAEVAPLFPRADLPALRREYARLGYEALADDETRRALEADDRRAEESRRVAERMKETG